MKGDVVGLFALAGGAMAALNTLNNMSVVARSLGAWVAPDYCALNSERGQGGPRRAGHRPGPGRGHRGHRHRPPPQPRRLLTPLPANLTRTLHISV